MSVIEKLRKLPDDKKKMVAAGIALFLTVIIAGSWFAFGPKKNNNNADLKPIIPDEQLNALKASVQKSIDDFNTAKDQLFQMVASTSALKNSTSTISTTTATTTHK